MPGVFEADFVDLEGGRHGLIIRDLDK